MNEALQWVAVALVLALAIVWIIRRALRKPPSDCSSPCDGCALANTCSPQKKNKKIT